MVKWRYERRVLWRFRKRLEVGGEEK